MTNINKIGRAWMLEMVPKDHSEIARTGGADALSRLRSLGYNYATAKQLCLAHKEQADAADSPRDT